MSIKKKATLYYFDFMTSSKTENIFKRSLDRLKFAASKMHDLTYLDRDVTFWTQGTSYLLRLVNIKISSEAFRD